MTGLNCGSWGVTTFTIAFPAVRFNEPALDMVPELKMLPPAFRTRFRLEMAPVKPVGIRVVIVPALIMFPVAKIVAVEYCAFVETMWRESVLIKSVKWSTPLVFATSKMV